MTNATTAKKSLDIKRLVLLAIFAAMAYILAFFRLPVMFLNYDTKDVIIAISGFLFGPLSAMLISLTVSLIEMVTFSDTGIFGAIMNFISTCAFVLPAACIYKRWHTMKGALCGLLFGIITAVITMSLWNYLIVPLYTPTIPRSEVVKMLLPLFVPFNFIKTAVNSGLILLIYKPLTSILKRARLLPTGEQRETASGTQRVNMIVIYVIAVLVIVSGFFLFRLF